MLETMLHNNTLQTRDSTTYLTDTDENEDENIDFT